MQKSHAVFAVALFAAGFVSGAWLDSPIMQLVRPQPPSFAYFDRVERLERFPPPGSVPFIGDSHVELGIWGMRIANYGVSRDTAPGVLKRLDAAQPSEQFILLIGVNDIIAGRNPPAVAEDIGRIVSGRNVTLLSVMPVRGRYAEHNAKIAELNSLLPALCPDQCTFVDTWKVMASEGELNARYTNDGLHLNAEGYTALASLLENIAD